MAFIDLPNIVDNVSINAIIWASFGWLLVVLVIVLIWVLTSRKKKGVDVSALAALASSDTEIEEAAPNADPKEVMAILQIERVAASTALSAVKDARKSKRISSSVRDSLINRYKARIAKIDNDLKRRTGAQEYQSLAASLEQSRDKIRGEVMPSTPSKTPPPPPPSSTPGIPSTAPPVPGVPKAPTSGPPSVPPLPSSGPPSKGTPPSKPASPIPAPPKISPVGPKSKPSTVVPPSVAPPTVSTPPMPPKVPATSQKSVAPPTTSDMAPPPVPTTPASTPAPPPATGDSDGQSISGLRMEMLRELARLKKFMSEETQ